MQHISLYQWLPDLSNLYFLISLRGHIVIHEHSMIVKIYYMMFTLSENAFRMFLACDLVLKLYMTVYIPKQGFQLISLIL